MVMSDSSDMIMLDGKLDMIPVLDTFANQFEEDQQRYSFVKQVMERSPEPTCGWNVLPNYLPDETIPLYVPIETLTDSELLTTLIKGKFDLEFEDTTPERLLSDPNTLQLIDVGSALLHEGKVTYSPQCCCDLHFIDDWKQFLTDKNEKWRMIWIGHPWILARFDADRILITEESENHPKPLVPRYSVNADRLREAVEHADTIVQAFIERVRAVIEDLQAK